jgi:flavin reductase (DIM6/NTAB) family NADH-FMN oxidoreductase RutF
MTSRPVYLCFGSNAPLGVEMSEADRDGFHGAMRSLASAVSLVTLASGSELRGVTAMSVTPLTAEPPTLIVCLNRAAPLYSGIAPGATFGVNILAADQQPIADRYAGLAGASEPGQISDPDWTLSPGGAPLLIGALAGLECEVEELIERRDRAIVIGRVRRLARNAVGAALVQWRGRYDQLGWADDQIARAIGVTPDGRLLQR